MRTRKTTILASSKSHSSILRPPMSDHLFSRNRSPDSSMMATLESRIAALPVSRPAASPPLPSGEYPAAAERRPAERRPAERRPAERRPADRKSAERRPRLVVRPTSPVPSESAPVVPVLRPLPTMTETPPAPLVSPRSVPTSSRIAREARVAGAVAPASQMAQTIRTLLRAKEGRGAALILAEVLGEPRGRQLIQRRKPQTG